MKAIESTATHSAAIQRKSSATPFFQPEESRDAFFGSRPQAMPFFNPGSPAGSNPSSTTIQAKLTIGAPNDVYEQEADAMADKVVQRLAAGESKPTVQRKCAECAKEDQEKGIAPKLQKKSIFESNEEPPAGQVQRKCQACSTETIQPKRIQRAGEKEEPELQSKLLQMKRIQRMGEEEEEPGLQEKPIQMKQIQRADEEEEPELQGKDIQLKRIQRMGGEEEEKPALQTKGGVPGLQASADLESRLNTTKGSGSPLPDDTRTSMESSFGTDFSNVRVHTNNSAVQMNQELGAQAFTHGSDIYFNSGKYDTGSKDGQRLLAHELTHTVQQNKSIDSKIINNKINHVNHNISLQSNLDNSENTSGNNAISPEKNGANRTPQIPNVIIEEVQRVLSQTKGQLNEEQLKYLGSFAVNYMGPQGVAHAAEQAGVPGASKRSEEAKGADQREGTIQKQAAEAAAGVAGTMWWLTLVDGPLPIGDIVYGALIIGAAITAAEATRRSIRTCRCTIRYAPPNIMERCPPRVYGVGFTMHDCQNNAKFTAPQECRQYYGHCGWTQ